jgi:hypothetical protein
MTDDHDDVGVLDREDGVAEQTCRRSVARNTSVLLARGGHHHPSIVESPRLAPR